MFSTLPKQNNMFSFTFILSSATAFNFDQFKILSFGKEYTKRKYQTYSNIKEIADDKLIVALMMGFASGSARNNMRKGEKCWLPAFSPFFSRNVCQRLLQRGRQIALYT